MRVIPARDDRVGERGERVFGADRALGAGGGSTGSPPPTIVRSPLELPPWTGPVS